MTNKSKRREIILEEMKNLGTKNINCINCPGHCCTSIANSMQTTPTETLDVLNFLRSENRWTSELKAKLQETITKFRLDQIPSNGKKNFLRRTYDCPFFAGSNLGCTIAIDAKPYGCLAFNPSAPNESEGKSCASDQKILKQREDENPDELSENQKIRDQYQIWWEKLPLPLALLEMEKLGL
jgi:Fe-S-cluster containining protein